jgi:hypothetical protein
MDASRLDRVGHHLAVGPNPHPVMAYRLDLATPPLIDEWELKIRVTFAFVNWAAVGLTGLVKLQPDQRRQVVSCVNSQLLRRDRHRRCPCSA